MGDGLSVDAQVIARVNAALALTLGVVGMVGWHLHAPGLFQLRPHHAPMQYNAALAFAVSGLVMLSALGERCYRTAAGAALIGAIGLATLAQYVFKADFAIDGLFVDPFVATATSHLGRMAPNTAIGFVLVGAAYAHCSVIHSPWYRASALGLLGALVVALGAATVLGYLSGIDGAYGWGKLTRMGLNTAGGFVVVGTGMIAQAGPAANPDELGARRWQLPLSLFVAGTVVVLVLWQALVAAEREHIRVVADARGELVAQAFERAAPIAGNRLSDSHIAMVLGAVSAAQSDDHGVCVLRDGRMVSCHSGPPSVTSQAFARDRAIGPPSAALTLRVFPSDELVAAAHSPLASIFLAGGLIAVVLSTFAIFLAQAARRQAVVLDRSRRGLQEEIAIREGTEQSLRESQRRFEQMAESIDQSFWIADLDPLALVYSSPAVEAIWGMSRDVSGTSAVALAYQLVLPADRAMFDALFEPLPDTKREARYRIVRADGEERWLRTRAVPIEHRDGRVSRIMGVTEDVTAATRATTRLHFNQDFERLITRLASDLMNAEPTTLDSEIQSALGRLGRFVDVDRVAIYAIDDDHLTASITHEWCTAGIVGVKELLQKVPLEHVRWFVERATTGDVSYLSIEGPPDDISHEAEMLRRFGVHSRIQVPLVTGMGLVGALVFIMTSPRRNRTQELTSTLSIAAQLCANALERKRSDATEAAYRVKLRTLAGEAAHAEERERRRIALGLHDGAIQNLGLARLRLSQLRGLAASGATIPLFDDVISLIERTTEETRSMVLDFSPPVLYELGIAAALEWLSDRTRERYGLECEFVQEGDGEGSIENAVAVTVFQAVRELLLNVHKHADASAARVILERRGERVAVRVEDDGCGFVDHAPTPSASAVGYGLFSIRERIELLGGGLSVESAPGRGSVVTLVMPSELGREVRA